MMKIFKTLVIYFSLVQLVMPTVSVAESAGEASFANCTIRPSRTVELTSAANGVVDEVLVSAGEHVKIGQVIARLVNTVDFANYELAKRRAEQVSRLEGAKAERNVLAKQYKLLKAARARRAVSEMEVEEIRFRFVTSENNVKIAEEEHQLAVLEAKRALALVNNSEIKSPIDGIVGEDLIDPGETVVNHPLALIYVNNPLRIEAFIPTQRINEIVNAKSHNISVNNQDEKTVVEFDYISPVADLSSNTTKVYFNLNSDVIFPGFSCRYYWE